MIKHIALTATAIVGLGLTALIFALPTPEATSSQIERGQAEQGQTYITNVRLIKEGTMTSPQTIRMENGSITAIEAGLKPPANAAVVDGSGLIALPGLIDSHTHSYGPALEDSLRFGVTANLDMFSDISILSGARQSRSSVEKTDRSDLFSSGMMATAPSGHGTQYGIPIDPITLAETARDWVRLRKAEGSDYIKMVYIPGQTSIPSITREIAQALITAAHEEGLMALAHISTEQAAQDLIEDGIDGLVHIFADKEASSEIITLAKKNDVFIIPTLSVIAAVDGKSANLIDSLPQDIQTRLSPMQRQTLSSNFPGNSPGFSYERALDNVKLFHDAGVVILAGSDAPNPGTAYGISLHLELQHLVEAGLTPAEALSAATSAPSHVFDLDERGTITLGNRADLVLVSGDPLLRIGDSLNISYVIKNGYEVDQFVSVAASGEPINDAKLSDFENGLTIGENLTWTTTSDGLANGKSKANVTLKDGQGLKVTGEVKSGFPYPWAGALITAPQNSPGVDISNFEAIEFSVKGTPGTYRVMTFHAGALSIPPTQEFVIEPDWKTVSLPLRNFAGFDSDKFIGFAFVAGPTPGAFEFQLDNVSLK